MPKIEGPPEQDDESVDLDDHADDGEAQEDDEDATKEGRRASGLVPLEEEPEGPLEANDEREATEEQDLEEKQEASGSSRWIPWAEFRISDALNPLEQLVHREQISGLSLG